MTNSELHTPELRLPKPPGVFRRWLATHPKFVDRTIVVVYLFGCALMVGIELLSGYSIGTYSADDPAADLDGFGSHLRWPWVLVSVAIVVAVAFALAYRRRFPFVGLLVVAVLLCVEQGLLAAPNSVALIFMLYAVPVYRSVPAGWVGFTIIVILHTAVTLSSGSAATGVVGPEGLIVSAESSLRDSITISVGNAIWMLAVLLIAINLGNRRRYIEALIDRAHQLATEREQRAQLAAAAERSRIAREMHDIVAHSLSVVVTLSEGASVAVDTQPEAAARAMGRAAETGRVALVEMRRLLGVLADGEHQAASAMEQPGTGTVEGATGAARPDANSSGASVPGTSGSAAIVPGANVPGASVPGASVSGANVPGVDVAPSGSAFTAYAPREPQPGVAQLYDLVDGFRQAGLRVSLSESGVAAGSASHQLAVFRIVQEALTNALRYAGRAAEVQVLLAHDLAGTRIEVVDSGRVTASSAGVSGTMIPGSGRGLQGAAERARMFGGSLTAGPRGLGWAVTAFVPGENVTRDTERVSDE